jgi:hypothetical protein
MRGLLVGITGLLGAAAFWRRRQKKTAELPAGSSGADPAIELRAKLAESRGAESAPDGDEPIVVADPEPSPLDPEIRRKSVHDRARASIDELK